MMGYISYEGLKDYPDIKKGLKQVANDLRSLTSERTYKANILSGIATSISTLELLHTRIKEEWEKEKENLRHSKTVR